MSDVMERTLSVLPGLLGQHDLGAGLRGVGGPGRVSATSRLGSLIRNITTLTSKHVRAAGNPRARPYPASCVSHRVQAGGGRAFLLPLPAPRLAEVPAGCSGALRAAQAGLLDVLWARGAAVGLRCGYLRCIKKNVTSGWRELLLYAALMRPHLCPVLGFPGQDGDLLEIWSPIEDEGD